MKLCRLIQLPLVLIMVAVLAPAGCRRDEPSTVLPENLGTAEKPLLPTQMSRVYDPEKIKGRAAPITAEAVQASPESAEPPADTAEGGQADAAGGDGGSPASDADREKIAGVVDQAVRRAVELRIDELVKLIDPQQQQAGAKLIEKLIILGATAAQASELEQQLGGAQPTMPIPGMPDIMGPDGKPDPEKVAKLIMVGDVLMTGSAAATAQVSAMQRSIGVPFVQVGDEWYIHVPVIFDDSATVDLLADAVDKLNAKVSDFLAKVKDGTIPPEQVQVAAQQMSQQLMMELMPTIMPLLAKFQAPPKTADETEPAPEEETDADAAQADTGVEQAEPDPAESEEAESDEAESKETEPDEPKSEEPESEEAEEEEEPPAAPPAAGPGVG